MENYVYSKDLTRWVKRPDSWEQDGEEWDYYERGQVAEMADYSERWAQVLADYPA